MASATSKETEIKLTNVTRASLEELLIDYEDFLRTNKLPLWEKNHRLAIRFRELNRTPDATYETYRKAIENPEPEICANVMICLIKIVTYLLYKQIKEPLINNLYIIWINNIIPFRLKLLSLYI